MHYLITQFETKPKLWHFICFGHMCGLVNYSWDFISSKNNSTTFKIYYCWLELGYLTCFSRDNMTCSHIFYLKAYKLTWRYLHIFHKTDQYFYMTWYDNAKQKSHFNKIYFSIKLTLPLPTASTLDCVYKFCKVNFPIVK